MTVHMKRKRLDADWNSSSCLLFYLRICTGACGQSMHFVLLFQRKSLNVGNLCNCDINLPRSSSPWIARPPTPTRLTSLPSPSLSSRGRGKGAGTSGGCSWQIPKLHKVHITVNTNFTRNCEYFIRFQAITQSSTATSPLPSPCPRPPPGRPAPTSASRRRRMGRLRWNSFMSRSCRNEDKK